MGLVDDGEKTILDVFFRNKTLPSKFYIRLTTGLSETSSIGDLSGFEPSTNGYAPQLVEANATGFPTLATVSGDWRITTKTVTFNATGGQWGPVTQACICTASDSNGTLLGFTALSNSRILYTNESINVSLSIKLQ